jgi:TP901 family phage tail tape measure protein
VARKEWELLFNLSAKQNSNFSSTFKAAQSALVETQNRIQQLNKVQSDITAYQKQQQAVDSTKQRLAVLQQQYDNIQKEIQETEGYSSALENKLISKQAQIDKTTASLHTYEQRLAATGNTLREAGVDTTQLTAETTRLETEVDKLKDQQVDLKKTMDEAGEGAKGFGEKSVEAIDAVESVLATAGIAKALDEIKDAYMDCINTAGDFEASMSNVEALSGASGNELEALSDKAKEMGATTKFTAGESADALSYMALAGWNTQSMLEGISPVLNLAAAANMDLAQASDIVTDYLTAFGLKASDTTHFVDVMAYAMAHSNTDVIQLGEAYKACASTATSLGYSVEETTAVLATMANAGVKGGEAGTALNAIFTRLATNTKKCGDELANYGVNIYDAQGNMQSLSSILTGIAGIWGDLTDQEQANLAKTIAGTNQYSKLQTIMAGCSEAAAEGGQSFSDYTEALNNCAGSADKMAGTMLDNMNGRLVLMQSAADGLKIAIGEDLTPAMSGLYDVGAQVLGWMQGFVEENPGVVKGIAAGTVTLGGLVGTLTAVAAGIKLAHAAATLFTGSLASLAGPLTLASVAIAGTVTLVTALATSSDDAVPSVRELTSAAREMGDSMEEAGNNYDATLSNMEATASVADQYISKLEAIEAATNGNTAGNAEYHDTLARLSALVPSLADDIDLETDSIKGGTEALRQHTDAYVADAKAQARQEYLNGLYEQYNNVLVESAENETKLATAQAKVEKSNAGMVTSYDKLLATLGMTDEQFKLTYGTVQDLPWRTMSEDVQQLRSEYLSYSADLVTARREVENYTEAMAQDQEAVDAAQTEYQEAAAAINGMADAQDSAADSAEDVAAALSAAQNNIQGIISAYNEAYDAALKSVSGQYDLWDTAEKIVATSASSINSALESQITYWDSYNQNLESLNARAADIDGLSAVIASFADGSKDSVNAIAGMASASDADLAKMVQNYQELQEAQKTTSESMADLETGMSNAMDEIAQNVADSVADMDLNDEAMKSAQSTIQGFIDGAEGMMPRVKEAYEKVANAASDALAGANKRYNIDQKNGNIPGYAVGTESAAPGFAIVGENGPELVYFNGGETVLTAPETRAAFNEARQLEQITSTNAIDLSAVRDSIREEQEAQTLREEYNRYVETVTGGNSVYFNGGETRSVAEVQLPGGSASGGSNTGSAAPITVAPVYHIYGMRDTDELRSVLNAQNDDLREAVLEIVSDNDTDNFRRGYA